jgi:hypothetical protein
MQKNEVRIRSVDSSLPAPPRATLARWRIGTVKTSVPNPEKIWSRLEGMTSVSQGDASLTLGAHLQVILQFQCQFLRHLCRRIMRDQPRLRQ